jgi:dynein assembly factor 2
VEEMNDPANRALYEKEMTQLEKERGVDITFIHPTPSYVIKSSVGGDCKAFINICSNEIVGRPKGEQAQENNSKGSNWSLPYFQSPPREDMDKNLNRCLIYDVIFHPDTLKLASCKPSFRKFVNDTAISAVEESFKVTLDKRNIKYPKLKYKGREEVTVIRKKSSTPPEVNKEDLMEIPNYVEVTEDPKPRVVQHQSVIIEPDSFTTPKYEIKQRKGIELHEFTEEIDSKMYAATPSELVVIIDLPLLKSAADVKLDVYEKALSLVSEKPARYMLDIKLPWIVDEESGNAKFDKSTKKLHVTLPVRKRKYKMTDFVREDSGIESDRSHSVKSSSEEDISESVVELPGSLDSEHYRTKEQTQSQPAPTTFLNPQFHYSFPPFTVNLLKQTLAIILHVPNIDQSSINRKFLENNSGVQVRLTSMGPGFFPIHYAFCINLPDGEFDPSSTSIETCDSNAVIRVTFSKCPSTPEYYTGVTPDDLTKNLFGEPINIANSIKEEKVSGNW